MSDTDPTTRQLVVFALGTEQYALPIASVSEIIRFTPPRSIATSQAWIRGVIGLRGKIVPIFDLSARLGLPGAEATENDKIVIVETDTGKVGVTVAAVDEVLTVSHDQIEPVPAGGADDGIEGIVKLGDRLVVLLEPAALLGDAHADVAVATE